MVIFSFPLFMFSLMTPQGAKLYNGKLIKKNSAYFLQTSGSAGSTKYSLKFSSEVIEKVIDRLVTDDFIATQAKDTSTETEKSLTISSINYVGLNILLGTWVGDDKVCYNFKNFTTLYIFNKNSSGECIQPAATTDTSTLRKLNYFVNPDDSVWTLLISNSQIQYAAELLINNSKSLQLNLFDEQTGAILRKTNLRR
jgi:hypothetical protein